MHCKEFESRLHELLDTRQGIASDRALVVHAECCSDCQRTLDRWKQIETALDCSAASPLVRGMELSVPVGRPGVLAENRWGILTTLAAAVACVALTFASPFSRSPDSGPPPVQLPLPSRSLLYLVDTPSPPRSADERAIGGIRAAAPFQGIDLQEIQVNLSRPAWWGEVVYTAWRPVDPLAEGIRPLADSLQSAIRLLAPKVLIDERGEAADSKEKSSARPTESRARLLASIA